ncbi:MAG: septum formation inhibitor [Odoribacteraceae bacterium]|jgi:cell division protein FtsB|nr:septum formation inhibitor [Odoribacteraceae bacterium]
MQDGNTISSNFFARLFRWKIAKYIVIGILFMTWMLLFDPYGYFPWRRLLSETRALEREKTYYIQKTAEERRKIDELQGSRDQLEKFAREQYLMKRPDEDIFIITDH